MKEFSLIKNKVVRDSAMNGLKERRGNMKQVLICLLILILSPVSLHAACPADNYTTTTCLYGETGTCRQSCDVTQAKVSATITASSDGDGVYMPTDSQTWTSGIVFCKAITIAGNGTNTHITDGISKASGWEDTPFWVEGCSSAKTIVFRNF